MSEDVSSDRPNWGAVAARRDYLIGISRTATGAESIRRVYDAARTLADGDNAITVAAVGQYCWTNFGGPLAQSIRNNKELKKLVDMAVQAQARAPKRPSRAAKGTEEERFLALIDNDQARAQVHFLLSERQSLYAKNTVLEANFKRLSALSFLKQEIVEADVDTLAELADYVRKRKKAEELNDFTEEEREAVRDWLEPSRLANWEGLVIDDVSGYIKRKASGRPFAKLGFLSALRKVAGDASSADGTTSEPPTG